MKKKYEAPKLVCEVFEKEEIILTSGGEPGWGSLIKQGNGWNNKECYSDHQDPSRPDTQGSDILRCLAW